MAEKTPKGLTELKEPQHLERRNAYALVFQQEANKALISRLLAAQGIDFEEGNLLGLSEFMQIEADEDKAASRAKLLGVLKEAIRDSAETIIDEKWLPLSHVEALHLSDVDINQGLWKAHKAHMTDLPEEDRFILARRKDISAIRQSPDARKQALMEAVSNAIDASTDRNIGEKGLGIKQALAYLEGSGDEITVSSQNGTPSTLVLRVKKGADDEYYENIQEATEKRASKGTDFQVTTEKLLSSKRIEEFEEGVKKRFRFTPHVRVEVNGELVNHYEDITDLEGNSLSHVDSCPEVQVTVAPTGFRVKDDGCGMDQAQLGKMFLERAGPKEMKVEEGITAPKVFELKRSNGHPQLFCSRQYETLSSTNLPVRLNLPDTDILIECPSFNVPESRQNLIVDERYLEVLEGSMEAVMACSQTDERKAQKLNFFGAFLSAMKQQRTHSANGSEKRALVAELLDVEAHLYRCIDQLVASLSDRYQILPNDPVFQTLRVDQWEKQPLYVQHESLNLAELPGAERVEWVEGAKVYAVPLQQDAHGYKPILEYQGSYLIDSAVVGCFVASPRPSDERETLRELMELGMNPIVTSYDERDLDEDRKVRVKDSEGDEVSVTEKSQRGSVEVSQGVPEKPQVYEHPLGNFPGVSEVKKVGKLTFVTQEPGSGRGSIMQILDENMMVCEVVGQEGEKFEGVHLMDNGEPYITATVPGDEYWSMYIIDPETGRQILRLGQLFQMSRTRHEVRRLKDGTYLICPYILGGDGEPPFHQVIRLNAAAGIMTEYQMGTATQDYIDELDEGVCRIQNSAGESVIGEADSEKYRFLRDYPDYWKKTRRLGEGRVLLSTSGREKKALDVFVDTNSGRMQEYESDSGCHAVLPNGRTVFLEEEGVVIVYFRPDGQLEQVSPNLIPE